MKLSLYKEAADPILESLQPGDRVVVYFDIFDEGQHGEIENAEGKENAFFKRFKIVFDDGTILQYYPYSGQQEEIMVVPEAPTSYEKKVGPISTTQEALNPPKEPEKPKTIEVSYTPDIDYEDDWKKVLQYASLKTAKQKGPYSLPKLPYALNALQPIYSEKQLTLHYKKHHQAYTDKLNEIVIENKLEDQPIEDLLANLKFIKDNELRQKIVNQGGGYWNHSFFWECLTPKDTTLKGKLKKDLNEAFDSFKDEFIEKGINHFGSGWVWLVVNDSNQLEITTTHDQVCPLGLGQKPLLCLDLWEHAYYVDYENKKSDYLKKMWKLIDWDKVSERYTQEDFPKEGKLKVLTKRANEYEEDFILPDSQSILDTLETMLNRDVDRNNTFIAAKLTSLSRRSR